VRDIIVTAVESPRCVVRPLLEAEIPAADRVQRVAFGTYLKLPDPMDFMGDGADIGPRWHIDPTGAFAAEIDGELVGAGYATVWGSLGIVGPMMVQPDYWNRGIAAQLLQAMMRRCDEARVSHICLVTFATSSRHIGLYQKSGFWPRYLTGIISRQITGAPDDTDWLRFSALSLQERDVALQACSGIADAIYPGLDLTAEIEAVERVGLGEVVLLRRDGALAGFAICHHGAGTEAGSGTCSVKFGAVRSGEHAPDDFARLLDACEALTIAEGLKTVSTAMNLAREAACRVMFARGYQVVFYAVAMHRPNEPGHNRPEVFLMESLA
jgi:GNAT superfamily N-acetyltransferase